MKRPTFFAKIHEFDDYSIRVVGRRGQSPLVHTFCTPWLVRAIYKYIVFSLKYREHTIVFTHNRYPKD